MGASTSTAGNPKNSEGASTSTAGNPKNSEGASTSTAANPKNSEGASTSTAANPKNSEYDVFLSHRGPDTKKGFASLLYHRLISFGLKVFLDQSVLERGGLIRPQIDSAIKSASVQVAILSPRYAESEWCLNELVSMFETGATIIPVFHKVEPSKVRWESLQKLKDKKTNGEKPRYDPDTIEKWRKALQGVADISGFELKECNDDKGVTSDERVTSDEGELLDQVVECVLKNVKGTSLNVADYPTGLDDKVKDFERILLPKPQVVGIVGLGGVGKTTLVKEFFNLNRSSYSRSCFLSDIRENASTPSLISLQNKLLKDLTGSKQVIDDIDVGITTLKKHLSSNTALIILDDVDNVTQVNALWPVHTVLHSDSLILITSRNTDVLISSRVEGSLIYTLTGLNEEYSRELFCWHSCRQPDPPVGFKPLVDEFVKVCEGLPLSLTVLGALVYKKDKAYWTEQLDNLRDILPEEINKKLKISYDALNQHEKEFFLDIACFFTRYNRDTAIRIWDGARRNGRSCFQNLQSRCLLRVDSENDIQMHAHLRDMGRDIAADLGGRVPENSLPRRLWRWTNDVINDLLQRKSGIIVRGIKMELSDYNSYNEEFAYIDMMRLQLLDTEEGILEHILNWVKLPNLIWIRWTKCPYPALPSSTLKKMKNLRVLQVSGSVLKALWEEDSQPPEELRELEIYGPLRNIPKSIGRLKNLERIVVGRFSNIGRVNLIELPEEFCELKSLKALVLKECSRLKSLPHYFGKLTTLEHIDLSLCRNLETLPDSFGSLKNLEHIDLSNCYDLRSLPDSFGCLGNLRSIDLQGCHKLKRLPDSFGKLKKLKRISISDCHGLRDLPESFGDLSKLEYIDFSRCHNLKSLPDSFGNLMNLQRLNLSNCHDLETLPDCFDNLKNLQDIDLSKCHNLERLPDSLRNPDKSEILCLEGCSYLTM